MEIKLIGGKKWYAYFIRYRYGKNICHEKIWAISDYHAVVLLTELKELGVLSPDGKPYPGVRSAAFFDFPIRVDSEDGAFEVPILGESFSDATARFAALRQTGVIVKGELI